jgi:hypothetical protein
VTLLISIYLVFSIGLLISFLALVSIGIGVFVEIVINGLKKNKFWAWIAGLILCGGYVPSLFVICYLWNNWINWFT